MQRNFDVVVIGLGIMGAAAAYHLARKGVKVLGLEAHGPGHKLGSSHGDSRIYRRAYWEGQHYVPLLNRSFDGWLELDAQSSDRILARTGGVFIGNASSGLVRRCRATAVECGIGHELLDDGEIRRRFPAFSIEDGTEAIYEPDAFMLFADPSRTSFLNGAVSAGASLAYGSKVVAVEPTADGGAEVITTSERIGCKAVVVTAGPWIAGLVPELRAVVRPMRIPIYWFDVEPERARHFSADALPVFLFEDADGMLLYGLPQWRDVQGGVKVGFHNHQLSDHDPSTRARDVGPEEIAEIRERAGRIFNGLRLDRARGITCVYTMTPDTNFVIGRSVEHEHVVYASACSGHGFKFAPGIGEALADLAVGAPPKVDLTAFRLPS